MEDSGTTSDDELSPSTTDRKDGFRGLVEISGEEPWAMEVFGAKRAPRFVRVNARALFIDNQLAFRLGSLASAFVSMPHDKAHVILIDRKNRRLTFVLRDRADADQLVDALGFGISQKTARFSLSPRAPIFLALVPIGFILWFVATLLVPVSAQPLVFDLGCAMTILIFLASVILNRRRERSLLIGRDGFVIFTFRNVHFIPYADVVTIAHDFVSDCIVITLRSGRVQIPAAGPSEPDGLSAIMERMKGALAAWRNAPSSESPELLERSGRTTREWFEALLALGAGSETAYREISIDRDALLSIAENPINQASTRAAAVIVLGKNLDDEARARLKASAESIAAPKLRVAIEHVVEKKPESDLETILDDLDPIARAHERKVDH